MAKNAKTIMYCVRRHYLKRSSASYLRIFDDSQKNKNKFKYLPTYILLFLCTNQIFTFTIIKGHLKDILLNK